LGLLAAVSILSAAHAAGDLIARGKYLATLGDCASCHTRPDAPAFTGGIAFRTPFGTLYSTNITPDREIGIGKWSAEDFYRAMHLGIRPDGAHLYPAFPYTNFTLLSRKDTDAILAYLRTIRPARAPARKNELHFGLGWRGLVAGWNLINFNPGEFRPDPARSPIWNRGAFLVHGLGHCGLCHTPKTVLYADRTDQPLWGEVMENWFAADLTGNPHEGLGKWSVADITQYLKTGRSARGRVSGTMTEVVHNSTSRMSDADRLAIATYLKSLPASHPKSEKSRPTFKAMQVGEAVYVQTCSLCHEAHGDEPAIAPSLHGDTVVLSRNPTTVVRIILQGAQSFHVPADRVGFSMPAFAALSDREIAGVATYIRNAWGNRASEVTEAPVSTLRKSLLKRTR
jgi:mono/diheme cytochrome c family protein